MHSEPYRRGALRLLSAGYPCEHLGNGSIHLPAGVFIG
jgi:hypothetical protein